MLFRLISGRFWVLNWAQPALHWSEDTAVSLRPWDFCRPCSGKGSMSKNGPKVYSSYSMVVGFWGASCRRNGLLKRFVGLLCPYLHTSMRVAQEWLVCVCVHHRNLPVLQQSCRAVLAETQKIASNGACLLLHGDGSSGPAVGHSVQRIPAPGSTHCKPLSVWGKWNEQVVVVMSLILQVCHAATASYWW